MQNGIPSVLYNFYGQVMSNLLLRNALRETLDAYIKILFDTNAATDRMSKRLFASSLFMAPFANFERPKTNMFKEQDKYSTMFAAKEQGVHVKLYGDVMKSLSSCSCLGREETPTRKLSNPHSKHRHSKWKTKVV